MNRRIVLIFFPYIWNDSDIMIKYLNKDYVEDLFVKKPNVDKLVYISIYELDVKYKCNKNQYISLVKKRINKLNEHSVIIFHTSLNKSPAINNFINDRLFDPNVLRLIYEGLLY